MPRLQPPPGFMTAKSATERLNISDATLYQYVRDGLLRRYGPEGRKHKFYKESEVESVFELRNAFGPVKTLTFFGLATTQDMHAIVDIDKRTFNVDIAEETYLRWMRKNPETFFVAREITGKVLGYVGMVPFKKEVIDNFVEGKISMDDITEADVEPFEPGRPLHIYVIAMCVDPACKASQKRVVGASLIRGVFSFLLDLAHRGVEIKTITARNRRDKPDGTRILRKLGIPQLKSPVPGKNLFSVNVPESGFPILAEYSEILENWKSQHQQ